MSKISILLTGIDFDWTAKNISADFDFDALRATFLALDKVQGLHHEEYFLIPGDEKTFEDYINRLRMGTTDGKEWDGVVIAHGLLANPKFTIIFERIVNTVREVAPKAKLLFPGARGEHEVAIRRNFNLAE